MAAPNLKDDDALKNDQRDHNINDSSNINQNPAPQTYKNAREYAQALRQWIYHYHASNAMHLVASNFAMQMQQFALLSNFGSNSGNLLCATNLSGIVRSRPDPYASRRPSPQIRQNENGNILNFNGQAQTPAATQANFQNQGVVLKVPTFWKRVAAEIIDFAFLFYLKLMISICLVTEFSLDLSFINGDDFIDSFNDLDYDKAFAITFEVIALEIINRVLITIFETLCIWRAPGRGRAMGATPGKKLMGLRVVSCDSVQTLDNGRVLVMPAGNISLRNAFLRSVIKNFTIAFFLPACLTLFFFKHNRTAYDVVAHTIVVEEPA